MVCESRQELVPLSHDLHRHIVLRKRALERFLKKIPHLTSSEIEEVRDLTALITGLGAPDFAFIVEAIERYKAVELVSLASDFHTFALFTIVEYLLTHPPRTDDGTDSLTKQVCRKCPEIAKSFDQVIVAGEFFAEQNEERMWKILYSYRSKIAHGGSIDFSARFTKKGFSELKGRKQIQDFMHVYVRLLLKAAARAPDKVRLLKAL